MTEAKKDIGYAFRIGAQTADGISIDITGNFPVDAAPNVINTELDKWIDVFSRQRAKTVLLEEERQLEKDKEAHASLVATLRAASEANSAKSADVAARNQMKATLDDVQSKIERRSAGIVSLKALM